MSRLPLPSRLLALTAIAALLITPQLAQACPFCSAVSQTLNEELAAANAAVIARLAEAAKAPKAGEDPLALPQEIERSQFEIVQVLKGSEHLKDAKKIEVLYFGQQPKDTQFLILGLDAPDISWNAPIPLTKRGVEYILALPKVPEKGADRLAFFQDYLEDPDEMLARDAYDEFAKAPYEDVKNLKDRMRREDLLGWIQDKSVLASRRRLYLTMLGVCGTKEDLAILEQMITRDEEDGEPKTALDAMIACYLTLKGPEGLPLIEERFLKDEKAQYIDTYAAIMALRFHGQEEKIIPKDRLVAALRHMLNRPEMADLVIPDLARWQDWESIDQLVKLFKEADEESSWVRVPVIQFLRACPLPEAKTHIAALEKIDPEAVKRASFFVPLGPAGQAGAAPPAPAVGQKPQKEQVAAAPQSEPSAQADPARAKPKPSADQPAETLVPPAPVEDDGSPPAAKAATAATTAEPAPSEQASSKPASQPAERAVAAASTRAAAQGQAKPAAAAAESAEAASGNSLIVVLVPAAVGLALLLLMVFILRNTGGRVSSEAKA